MPGTWFREALAAHLRDGSFRVVIVLGEAPPGLVRLAGYLETIADRMPSIWSPPARTRWAARRSCCRSASIRGVRRR